ncbi:hypothetical protein D3C71_2009190 [compost metagenome]
MIQNADCRLHGGGTSVIGVIQDCNAAAADNDLDAHPGELHVAEAFADRRLAHLVVTGNGNCGERVGYVMLT